MHERGFTHHTRRRSDASRDADANLVQLTIRGFQHLWRGSFTFANFWFVLLECLDDRRDRIFACGGLGNVSSFELIRIDVANKPAQRIEMLAPCLRLIVFFNEGHSHESVNSKW